MSPPDLLRRELAARLRVRSKEIQGQVWARVYALAETGSPIYRDGLRAAVTSALEYALSALEGSTNRPAPIPAEVLAQARRAARSAVPLDMVLRRYLAGHSLLDDFILQEAEGVGLQAGHLQAVLRAAAETLNHLVTAAAAEYNAEREALSRSRHRRRSENVERLLAGFYVNPRDLDYDVNASWHLGLVAAGTAAEPMIRSHAAASGCRLLLVPREEDTCWAWLGAREESELEQAPEDIEPPDGVRIAFGELGWGPEGWALTHRQAATALPIARRGSDRVVRYRKVALLSAAIQDDVLASSLSQLFLAPLSRERDGGQALKETLRAYFATEQNVSSTASAIGVSRKTVRTRLQCVERCIGQLPNSSVPELEVALQLDEMGRLKE